MSLLDLVNERRESMDVWQSRRESEAEEDLKAQVRAQVSGSDYNPSGSSTLTLDHSASVFGTDGAHIIPCVLGLSLAFQTYTGKCFQMQGLYTKGETFFRSPEQLGCWMPGAEI